MEKINKLTNEQEALIPVVRNEWIKFCLDGNSSIDRKKLHEGIEWIYGLAKLNKPMLIVLQGPLACQYGANLITFLFKDKKKLAQVRDQVRDQVQDQVQDQVRDQVQDQVQDQVRDQVWAQVGDQVGAQVWAQVGAQVWAQVRDQVRDQVQDQVQDQVRDQVWDQVQDQVGAQVRDQVRDQVGKNYFDFAWVDLANYSGWLAWVDYFKKIGIEITDKFDKYKSYLESGPFYTIFLRGIAIVCCRPSVVNKNSNFRLHCENGPAAEWPNGEKYWFLNGIRMREADVMTPAQKLDPKEVMKRENVDERRELIRKIGIERMLSVMKSKTLDTRGDYSLLSIELSEAIKDVRYLKMKNPSIGIWHLEGVARECKTVQEAINWRAGDINKNWEPANLT